mmetsp:Transcript_51320/g.128790  ORF Transcript_51320/g.128790 Transcript_51320/m.128790 type:complete len:274 (-) Transcript_51320:51-872(-)
MSRCSVPGSPTSDVSICFVSPFCRPFSEISAVPMESSFVNRSLSMTCTSSVSAAQSAMLNMNCSFHTGLSVFFFTLVFTFCGPTDRMQYGSDVPSISLIAMSTPFSTFTFRMPHEKRSCSLAAGEPVERRFSTPVYLNSMRLLRSVCIEQSFSCPDISGNWSDSMCSSMSASSSSVHESNLSDRTCEICVPRDLCAPAQRRQRNAPRLSEAQSGSGSLQSLHILLWGKRANRLRSFSGITVCSLDCAMRPHARIGELHAARGGGLLDSPPRLV